MFVCSTEVETATENVEEIEEELDDLISSLNARGMSCLLYTSDAADE